MDIYIGGVFPTVDPHGRITGLLQVWALLTDIAGTFPAVSSRTSLISHSRLFELGWGLYSGSEPFPYGAALLDTPVDIGGSSALHIIGDVGADD